MADQNLKPLIQEVRLGTGPSWSPADRMWFPGWRNVSHMYKR
jgi:hypothetical protein